MSFWYRSGMAHAINGDRGKKKSCNRCGYRILPGGDKRDRTADLLNAIQALSQYMRVHTPSNGRGKYASIHIESCYSDWSECH